MTEHLKNFAVGAALMVAFFMPMVAGLALFGPLGVLGILVIPMVAVLARMGCAARQLWALQA